MLQVAQSKNITDHCTVVANATNTTNTTDTATEEIALEAAKKTNKEPYLLPEPPKYIDLNSDEDFY